MNKSHYINKLRIEVVERSDLIKYMQKYNIPFNGMNILIEQLRQMKQDLADLEYEYEMNLLRLTKQD